jgi:glycosyltransferase involved in cell wall biosynthesis
MRVLQIGSDRSRRGILYPDSQAVMRQRAYGEKFGDLDIVGFSVRSDGCASFEMPHVHIYPTNSISKLSYGIDTMRISGMLQRPDVISAQDPFETGLLALLIARMRKIPLHVQVHTDFLSPEYARHSAINRLRVMVARYVLKRATRIRVVSERVKDEIMSRYDLLNPVSVLPIFVDVAKFRDTKANHKLLERFASFSAKLLVVSRLEPEKNVALAIKSFAASAPHDACLIIVGTGSQRAMLEKLAHEVQVSDRVFFEGDGVPADYYPFADLLLVTSCYEGYGLVIVEALAAGKPVLSTDVGIGREMGTIITNEKEFPSALKQWFVDGPRTMHLDSYPYENFDQYADAYCADIISCITKIKKA